MSREIIRPYREADRAELVSLWSRTFGDPPELAEAFLQLLPELGVCCVAEQSGRVLGAAYVITAFQLLRPGESPLRCGYLYAVAVEEAARRNGLGEKVSRGAAEMGRDAGARILTTLPAEETLYAWYERILQLRWRTARTRFSCDALPPAERVSSEIYASKRELILMDRVHMELSPAALRYEQLLCEQYGGGLYLTENALFCAYREGSLWILPELLAPEGTDGLFSGLKEETLPYVCADSPLPDDLIWNLTFD